MRPAPAYSAAIRIAILAAVVGHIAYVIAYPIFSESSSITDVMKFFGIPSVTAVAVIPWIAVCTALLVYGIVQLFLSPFRAITKLSRLLFFFCALGCLWISLASSGHPGGSLLVMALLLVIAWILFRVSHNAVMQEDCNLWLRLPFCMAFAWLCVMLPLNATMYMRYEGIDLFPGHALDAAVPLALGIAGIVVCRSTGSLVFPLIIAYGIYHLPQSANDPFVEKLGAVVGIALPVICTLMAINGEFRFTPRPRSN